MSPSCSPDFLGVTWVASSSRLIANQTQVLSHLRSHADRRVDDHGLGNHEAQPRRGFFLQYNLALSVPHRPGSRRPCCQSDTYAVRGLHLDRAYDRDRPPVTFVSYAKNFEDVMLWRALQHVANGFYIDIGAQDPVVDSVSLAFYEHGWRGVHIEPTPHYAEKLRQARPDETVIQAAVGAASGTISFFEIPDTGLSTGDKEIAERHRAQGFHVREMVVPCLTLTEALDPYSGREIHWMKIDVEGFERQVIEGWDAGKIRPWIVVMASIEPRSNQEAHPAWESLVIGQGYRYAYCDGLNLYYVSEVRPDLLKAFDCPPNCSDFFELSGRASHSFVALLNAQLASKDVQLSQVQQELAARNRQLAAREGELVQTRQKLRAVQAHLAGVNSSWSWRVTEPLRRLKAVLRGLSANLRRQAEFSSGAAVGKDEGVSATKFDSEVAGRLDIQRLLTDIRAEIGHTASSGAERKAFVRPTPSAMEGRLRAYWVRLPPRVRYKIRRISLFHWVRDHLLRRLAVRRRS